MSTYAQISTKMHWMEKALSPIIYVDSILWRTTLPKYQVSVKSLSTSMATIFYDDRSSVHIKNPWHTAQVVWKWFQEYYFFLHSCFCPPIIQVSSFWVHMRYNVPELHLINYRNWPPPKGKTIKKKKQSKAKCKNSNVSDSPSLSFLVLQ